MILPDYFKMFYDEQPASAYVSHLDLSEGDNILVLYLCFNIYRLLSGSSFSISEAHIYLNDI